MRQKIHVYGDDPVRHIAVTERVVREGVIQYRHLHYKVFSHHGQPSIQLHNPIKGDLDTYDDEQVISRALELLRQRIMVGDAMESPDRVKHFLALYHASHDIEVFSVLYLNSKHRVLGVVEHSRGDLNRATVYPRQILEAAFRYASCAIVLSHNHPNQHDPTPSSADRAITRQIIQMCTMVDIRVLDHIVSSGSTSYSFAEHGELQ